MDMANILPLQKKAVLFVVSLMQNNSYGGKKASFRVIILTLYLILPIVFCVARNIYCV